MRVEDLDRPLASAFSFDRRLYATGNVEGGFSILETSSAQVLCRSLMTALALSADWNHNATFAAFGMSSGAAFVAKRPNVPHGAWTITEAHKHRAAILDVQFSQNGRWLALACEDASITLLSLLPGPKFRFHRRLTGFSSAVYRVTFSSDGRFLVGLDENDSVLIFDATDGAWTQRTRLEGAGMVDVPALFTAAPTVITHGVPKGYPTLAVCNNEGDAGESDFDEGDEDDVVFGVGSTMGYGALAGESREQDKGLGVVPTDPEIALALKKTAAKALAESE